MTPSMILDMASVKKLIVTLEGPKDVMLSSRPTAKIFGPEVEVSQWIFYDFIIMALKPAEKVNS